MDELERLGRNAAERLRQVAEDAFNQALVALLPLIEQLIQRLTVLWELLRLLVDIFVLFWLQLALGQAMEQLADAAFKAAIFELIVLAILAGALVVEMPADSYAGTATSGAAATSASHG